MQLWDTQDNPLHYPNYDIGRHSIDSIYALFIGTIEEGERFLLFQLFEKRHLISAGKMTLFFDGNTFLKIENPGIVLDNKLLAILHGDQLIFKSFSQLRKVFDVDDLFEEASNADIEMLSELPSISIPDLNGLIASCDSIIRKKIGLIMRSQILETHSPQSIQAAAQGFGINISMDNGKIVLPSDRHELKRIIRFLDEDYYEAPISHIKYVSNSKRAAE